MCNVRLDGYRREDQLRWVDCTHTVYDHTRLTLLSCVVASRCAMVC